MHNNISLETLKLIAYFVEFDMRRKYAQNGLDLHFNINSDLMTKCIKCAFVAKLPRFEIRDFSFVLL